MLFDCNRHLVVAAALLLVFCNANATITAAPKTTSAAKNSLSTCEFRTINYITDSLPQLCLRSSWSNSNGTSYAISGTSVDATVTRGGQSEGTLTSNSDISTQDTSNSSAESESVQENTISSEAISRASGPSPTPTEAVEGSVTDIESGELNESSFLSFEEWRRQTLEKAGQANANIGNKRYGGAEKKRDLEGIQNNLDSLGDEGEIDLDFAAFRSGESGDEEPRVSESTKPDLKKESQDHEGTGRRKDQYRSKDAGKTCKERFSYASFDAGATILKTHPGAKNPKAVLIENKDSYMLSECAAENKFLIVELSEDIWIDTVVLANFEFFSSMIRNFHVSVSDRYPVKMEKWKDLGIYEARNSREIQAFLIENPQIWARYLRIEFLSHYGSEYYCPLSLVRVHGTRMLESWKETEASSEDDDAEENDERGPEELFVPDAVAEVLQEEERLNAEGKGPQAAIDKRVETLSSISYQKEPALNSSRLTGACVKQISNPWVERELHMFQLFNISPEQDICLREEAPDKHTISTTLAPEPVNISTTELDQATVTPPPPAEILVSAAPTATVTSPSDNSISGNPAKDGETSVLSDMTTSNSDIQDSISSVLASATNKTSGSSYPPSVPSKSHNITSSQRNKTTSTSSAPSPLPTIQESFFKAVSRRLQLLETSSTLSLKYIEEQSRILREAFTKVEKKQLQKTTTFLDTLNSTVLAELRGFRQQYDEIWQSTVISLESQREESRREILAISTRLNILADEVVFQKRMSIVQSVLLLLCLSLVIFSRVSAAGHLDFPSMQARARSFAFLHPSESPPESPSFVRTGSIRDSRHWVETEHRGQRADGSPVSRSRSTDGDSPPTPVSSSSPSENALTPPSGAYDNAGTSIANIIGETLEHPARSSQAPQSSAYEGNEMPDGPFLSPSPTIPTQKKRNGVARQQLSSPPSGADDTDLIDESTRYQNLDTYDAIHEISHEQVGSADLPPRLPSPPAEKDRPSFSSERKPLPALPPDGS